MNRNAINIYFYLRHEARKGKKEQINARLKLGTQTCSMGSTGLYVTPSVFSGGKVVGRSREANKLREELFAFTCKINFLYERMCDLPHFSLKALCKAFKSDKNTSGMRRLFSEYLETRKKEIGGNIESHTFRKYEITKKNFFQFLSIIHGMTDIDPGTVNKEILASFHSFLLKDLSYERTTAYRQMRRLKSVFIFASNRCYISINPFINYRLHQELGERPFLTEQELILINETFLDSESLVRVRDLFMFSCFTGLSYIDLKTLCKKNIKTIDGKTWIIKRREKTKTSFQIPLFEYPASIIKKYNENWDSRNQEDPLFTVISNQKINKNLKEIAQAARLDKNLTFHVARHTFATLTLGKGVSIESVSGMLGHTDIKTTKLYAKITDMKIAREMRGFSSEMKNIFKPL